MANRGFFGIPPGPDSALVWIRVNTWVNSWVNYDADTVIDGRFCAYAKDERTGLVYLRGLMKSGTVPQVAFYLPIGYRPTISVINMYFPAISAEAFGACRIVGSDGSFYMVAGSANWFSLSGIVFPSI